MTRSPAEEGGVMWIWRRAARHIILHLLQPERSPEHDAAESGRILAGALLVLLRRGVSFLWRRLGKLSDVQPSEVIGRLHDALTQLHLWLPAHDGFRLRDVRPPLLGVV